MFMSYSDGTVSSMTLDHLSSSSTNTDELTDATTSLTADPLTTPDFAAAGSPLDESTTRFEVRYLQETIDHYTMAIEMAELAVDKAVNDDIRSLAQNIVETQTEERARMQSWLKDWYGFDYEPEMSIGEDRMVKEMSVLRGSEFEIEFMQQMTMHHMAGINDATSCTARAGHAELVDLCNNIASTQMREAEQMKEWLSDRYQTGVGMIGVSPDADTDGSIDNGSFERGNFTGWSVIGHADIQTLDYGVSQLMKYFRLSSRLSLKQFLV
jgi:uncharacterized protein (DUF305 family)